MISAVNAIPATAGGNTPPNAEKLAELSQKAIELQQRLVLAKKTDAKTTANDASQADSVSHQLDTVQAQIDRLILAMQLSRIGSGTDAADGTDRTSAPTVGAAKQGQADASHTGEANAAPGQHDAQAKARRLADPYRPTDTPGNLVNLSS